MTALTAQQVSFPAFYETMTNEERAEWAALESPAFTPEETAGLAQFRMALEHATAGGVNEYQIAARVKMLRDGRAAKMRNAPRQQVIDAMIAMCAEYGY